MSDETYRDIADQLLLFAQGDSVKIAKRISAVYGALFESEPVLLEWCGLACLFYGGIADSLSTESGFYEDVLRQMTVDTHHEMLPNILAFRAGAGVDFTLPYQQLQAARQLRAQGKPGVLEAARLATRTLIETDQGNMQKSLSVMPEILTRGLVGYTTLRLSEEGDVHAFDGDKFGVLNQRLAWWHTKLTPDFRQAVQKEGVWLVSAIRRRQEMGWFSVQELPD